MKQPGRPEGPSGDRVRLQPDEAGSDDELDTWLADSEFAHEAERLRRLGGDQELLLRLQLNGYTDAVWRPVAEEFARYGMAVMKSWLRRRTIFAQVKTKTGYGLPRAPEEWLDGEHTIDDLATMTVVPALAYFKTNVLMQNRWDPSRGASLRTFFIGQCLYQFCNPYRAWYQEEQERRALADLVDNDDLDYLHGSVHGVEEQVVLQSEVKDALRAVGTALARRAFILRSAGYTYREIAIRLGLPNDKAVENILGHQARRIQRRKNHTIRRTV